MKKMSKMGKSILLSSLAIIAFGGIAAGTTYALFTSDATTSVSVTTGKVKVTQTVAVKEYYSPEAIDSDGTITEKNVATNGTSSDHFYNGGSATVNDEDGTVKITNMTPGDKITLTVTPTNESNVKIKYRETYSIEGDNTNKLDVSSNDRVNLWTALDEKGTIKPYDVTIELPTTAAVQELTTTIKLKVEAVQGNAKVADPEQVTVENAEQLAEQVKSVPEGSTVKIASENALNLANTLVIDKNMDIVVASDVIAPEGKSAIEVTEGKTVTLSAATVSDSSSGSHSRVKYANSETMPTIKSTGDEDAIVASGEGSKVVIDGIKVVGTNQGAVTALYGGEVVINSGVFYGYNGPLYARSGSKITVNGGTFTSADNFVVGTNGSVGWGSSEIVINDGEFNGLIEKSSVDKGFIGCGVYVANRDKVTINGGTFNITDGCGVLARSGDTYVSDKVKFNFTYKNLDSSKTGYVGDTKINIPVGKAIVQDFQAGYPGGVPLVDTTQTVTTVGTKLTEKEVSSENELRTAVETSSNDSLYIKLTADIETSTRFIVNATNTTIDLGGHIVTVKGDNQTFRFDGKKTSFLVNGTIDGTAINQSTADGYNNEIDPITGFNSATVYLYDVNVKVKSITGACVYANNSTINVMSGTYSNSYKDDSANTVGMSLNQNDVETQFVKVYGGTFIGTDPSVGDKSATGVCKSFLATPKATSHVTSTKQEDGSYVVKQTA